MGFIPGRDIADNMRRTINVIAYGRCHHISSILVALDVKKAFDIVICHMWTLIYGGTVEGNGVRP